MKIYKGLYIFYNFEVFVEFMYLSNVLWYQEKQLLDGFLKFLVLLFFYPKMCKKRSNFKDLYFLQISTFFF